MLKTLARLPRDARDTLFLLMVIAWVILPHMEHLPLWCSLLATLLIVWRGVLGVRARTLPSRWWLLGLLALTLGATFFSFRTVLGRDAGVTMIVVLLVLKTLEMRARRDAFVVFFLGFFTLLTNFFYSQSLLTAAAMLLALLGLLTALVNAHMPVGKPPLRQAARIAGSMALLGAPIMVVLFLLFPRMAPLWGMPSDAMSGRSGLSTNMAVGAIASLARDDSIAMRVRFDGVRPAPSDLYFRGPVLSTFDGREWRMLRTSMPARQQATAELKIRGAPVRYQLTLEPNNRPWLMMLDAAPDKPAISNYGARMTPDLQWLVDRPVTELLRYEAQSYPDFQHGPMQMVPALQDYLLLPAGYNPRTAQLATELRRAAGDAVSDKAVLVNAALEHLRSGGYRYTLDPGIFGRHSADEFWFDRRQGFCEHIASSFVILMRAMGIPARVVTGYQGGENNPVDGFLVVRQSDAHAWSEVWLAGRGWQRVDPTSAVAPGRTGAMQRLASERGLLASALLGSVSPALALNLRAFWDAVNNGWNQWVLNYTQGRQFDLLRKIGFSSPGWEDLSYTLIALVVSASLMGALWTLWERRQHDPWLRLLARVTTHLRKTGLNVAANTPPRRLAEQLQQQRGSRDSVALALSQWLVKLEAHRYAARDAGRAGLATLQKELTQIIRRQ